MPKKNQFSIKLLQLPIPEIHDLYSLGNIPLAAGYLEASALKAGLTGKESFHILPRSIANYAGDPAILDWILEDNPTVVGFSSYMWNIRRNIHLAQKLKETSPDTIVIMGGPEIDPQHWAIGNNSIDAFVFGEGEGAFIDLLRDVNNQKPLERFYRHTTPVNLEEIPNPYLEYLLVPQPNESMFLETMRGCPYPCKYCFYSKSYSSLRFFPAGYLPKLFALARDYEVPELYFMDPSFNVSPHLARKLEYVQHLNTTGIPIHTEIRLEGVTREIASSMKKAGFRSVEAGLQSVNEKSLAAIGRSWDRKKFRRGAQLLQEQGIDIKTGIILGLPYDDLKDLERTLDFVMDLNLAESMEIYPLSLIPGTQLRDEAGSFGITYMPHPPYWVLSTPFMEQWELKSAIELIENKLDIEFFPPIIPRFENSYPPYIHFLDLRERKKQDSQLSDLYRAPERIGHSLTLLTGENCDLTPLVELGRWLQQVSPSSLIQLVMDRETLPPPEDLQRLSGAFFNPHHYFNHIHRYKSDSQGQYSLRFFHLTTDPDMAESYIYQPRFCDLVLRFTPGWLEKSRGILEQKPLLLVDSPVSEKESEEINRIYQGFENLLIFSRY